MELCIAQRNVDLNMSLQAILIRIGIDQEYGSWNAPCNPETGDFVYVPIPQDRPNIHGMENFYKNSITSALNNFSVRNNHEIFLPKHLENKRMHLDPDFNYLSYGDTADRGRRLMSFKENDIVVFYSSLRSIHGDAELVYALVGLLAINSIEHVKDVRPENFYSNAHTRNKINVESDIIIRGKPGISGRFSKYIPIGEFRKNSYRVKKDLLDQWGNIGVKDGWIQRSANPPLFLAPEQFIKWLEKKSPILIASNN